MTRHLLKCYSSNKRMAKVMLVVRYSSSTKKEIEDEKEETESTSDIFNNSSNSYCLSTALHPVHKALHSIFIKSFKAQQNTYWHLTMTS